MRPEATSVWGLKLLVYEALQMYPKKLNASDNITHKQLVYEALSYL
jgi:hypothetical protein